ncbi:unnamed protein product [Paramecium sonneborni]|uniref:Major facilitator superfamily (MFS) profile domain-containing protein n=1 Tax=Paramecium sonneborni TaxID=65129 RepID=A0A8S1MYR3_9CILI|nr:unnamed protein product [Paramecium sonneborni]
MITDLIGIIGVVLEIISNIYSFFFARILIGLCVGLNSSLIPQYIKEFSPSRLSGSLGALNQLTINIGILIGLISAFFYQNDPNRKKSNDYVFRLFLEIPLIFCVIRTLLLIFVFKNEPPSYYVQKNDLNKFGDSYYEIIDELALQDICDNIKINKPVNQDDLLLLEEELLFQLPKLWIFLNKTFYPYCSNHQISEVELETFKSRVIVREGTFVNSLYDDKLDFIILFKDQTFIQNERLKQFFNDKPYIQTTTYSRLMQLIEEQQQTILPS